MSKELCSGKELFSRKELFSGKKPSNAHDAQ